MQKTILLGLFAGLCALTGCKTGSSDASAAEADSTEICPVTFSGDSALAYATAQCDFGARTPGSEAHRKCGDYIVQQFRRHGLSVCEQTAPLQLWDGKKYHCRNIIAAYNPDAQARILLCAHWDSRPWADADPDSTRHRSPVLAANDGASGVAVLLEVARALQALKPAIGIDMICFDLEDYGAPYWAEAQAPDDGSDWCVGSRYWAENPHKAAYTARYGVLLDMVGGENAHFRYEGVSMRYAPGVVARVWAAARTAGYAEIFPEKEGGWITDDHVPLNEIAGLPTIDIIPYYEGTNSFGPTWHTTKDTPEHLSANTLQAVGQTLLQLIYQEEP